jgi:hypothetical protein
VTKPWSQEPSAISHARYCAQRPFPRPQLEGCCGRWNTGTIRRPAFCPECCLLFLVVKKQLQGLKCTKRPEIQGRQGRDDQVGKDKRADLRDHHLNTETWTITMPSKMDSSGTVVIDSRARVHSEYPHSLRVSRWSLFFMVCVLEMTTFYI